MLNKDPYNNKTYLINWLDIGTQRVKVFHTRSDARDFKAKLKQRLGKKWHEYIEMKQVVITQGFIESTKICR